MTGSGRIDETVRAFQAAGLGEGAWPQALACLATATGSRAGQLIGFGSETALRFNWTTGIPDACLREFAEDGWADPEVNPRVRFGSRAGEMRSLTEAEFAPDFTGLPFYEDFSRRWDLPFSCIMNLVQQDGGLIGLAVIRSAGEGPITPEQRAVFDAVAPHARHAVRTQMALQGRGSALLQGALEALDLAVLVCERDRRIRAASPKAEALLDERTRLSVQDGRLCGGNDHDSRALSRAVATAGDSPAGRAHLLVALRDADGRAPLLAEIAPMPGGDYALGFEPTVLLVLRAPRAHADERTAGVATIMFDLSPAEGAIAADLIAGRTARVIAERRGVAIGTVRSQIRALFDKVGVRSQIELVAALGSVV